MTTGSFSDKKEFPVLIASLLLLSFKTGSFPLKPQSSGAAGFTVQGDLTGNDGGGAHSYFSQIKCVTLAQKNELLH